ncbi:MAG: hypothetical protein WAZ76_00970, partial [Blautia wexlerae]
GIIVICFGVFQPGSIFEINLFAFSGMAIFVVPILFGIYWKKATAKGAVAAVIAGIVAAGMSTIDGILVTTTGAVTRDIYQKIINKDATDENVMKLSKVVTVIIGIIVICFGVFQPGSIFEINLFAFSGMAIFVVPILFGIYWKKATAKGAIASVIVGIISLLLFTLNPSVKALAMGFHALFPTTIIASIVMIVVSKFTETPPQETIDRHFTV